MNKKKSNIRKIRYAVQALGAVLTAIGVLSGYPLAKALLVGATVVMGPVFCGWICPFGTLQDLFGRLGGKLGIRKLAFPDKLKRAIMPLRYVLLIVTAVISFDFIFTMLSLDPRNNFESLLGGSALTVAGWAMIAMFLIISIVFDRPFCNYLCIEGAKFGLMSSLRPVTILRNAETCIDCRKCNRSCPMNIDVASHSQVRSLQCISCMECVSSCPVSDTLTFGMVPAPNRLLRAALYVAVIAAMSVSGVVAYKLFDSDSPGSSSAVANNSFETGTGSETGSGSYAGPYAEPDTQSDSGAGAADAAADSGDAAGIEDGVYTGTGTGFRGDMTVEVTVSNERITDIEIIETNDDDMWLERAYDGVASDIVSSQTADVDSVSGATYSSMGIKEAVADALMDAGGQNVGAIENDMPQGGDSHVPRM